MLLWISTGNRGKYERDQLGATGGNDDRNDRCDGNFQTPRITGGVGTDIMVAPGTNLTMPS
jgi:hypothetical protein